MRLLAYIASLFWFVTPAHAQANSFVCDFVKECSLDGCRDAAMQLTFLTVNGEAYMQGNNGLARLGVVGGYDGITFLEALDGGVVQTTTVSATQSVVHSRHTIILGDFVASQWHGTCQTFTE